MGRLDDERMRNKRVVDEKAAERLNESIATFFD